MDYLLRDAYFTGVNYGTFDLERILRVLRPYKGKIVVKESGMHAVEHYLMSRYQMYWQIYFHPVTRSSEIILRQIFRRAQELYEGGYTFEWMPSSLKGLLQGTLNVQDYLKLDEALVQTAFTQWMEEHDPLLSDLCDRFLNRRLYKYITIDNPDETLLNEISDCFSSIGMNPDYHMEIDFPFDLPYDVYRPDKKEGEKKEKAPILLLDHADEISEISAKSDIVRSITGLHQGQYHLYYPEEPLRRSAHLINSQLKKLFKLD
jgi:HD superfamily phosphohydrolase